mgnify:CR=1 FL=1
MSRVLFCLPGRTFSDKFLKSWTNLMVSLTSRDITFGVAQGYDPVVYYARNKCLGGDLMIGPEQKPWNGEVPYDYMMWIDSDIVFEPQNFKQCKTNPNILRGDFLSIFISFQNNLNIQI